HSAQGTWREDLGIDVGDLGCIDDVDAQIFAPCALGGVLDAGLAETLRARIVCGAANNQLATPEIAERLRARRIVYAPDYVVNAGGIINVAAEYLAESADEVRGRVMAIGPRTRAILDQAASERLTTSAVADQMAEDLMRYSDAMA
ncbi:MAG: amino acid dehydrogenase, partial [Hyphomicrobiales bacterium]